MSLLSLCAKPYPDSFDEMERLILVNSILDSKDGADNDELRQENIENIERHMRSKSFLSF